MKVKRKLSCSSNHTNTGPDLGRVGRTKPNTVSLCCNYFQMRKRLRDRVSQVCSWVLGISGGKSLIDLALRVRKRHCIVVCGIRMHISGKFQIALK